MKGTSSTISAMARNFLRPTRRKAALPATAPWTTNRPPAPTGPLRIDAPRAAASASPRAFRPAAARPTARAS